MSLCDVTSEHGVYTLTLQRPEALNALSQALLAELSGKLHEIASDPAVCCVIVTGSGRAFCAGADLKERSGMTEQQTRQAVAAIRGVINQVAALRMPVLAAIGGAALGGGLELALACDLRVVSEDAQVGLTETRLAIIPGAGGTQRLARLIGSAGAKDLIFTGRKLSGAEAYAVGIAQRLAPIGQHLLVATQWAAEIATGGPIALRAAKTAIDEGLDSTLAEGLAIEQAAYENVIGTADRAEGLRAFMEKRRPMYQGR